MNSKSSKKSSTNTEILFGEYFSEGTKAVLDQIESYRKIADIYDRTQFALGRKVAYKSTNSSTAKVKINLDGIRATNKV